MSKTVLLVATAFFFLIAPDFAWPHHYKGLPHNDYFKNYPQVPSLEFLLENDRWEVFVTVFNFDGIDLENVQDSNVIRFYIFLYDIIGDKVYGRPTTFEIYSGDRLVARKEGILPEQENIYLIQQELIQQSDLKLRVLLETPNKGLEAVDLPFQIKKSLWQKFRIPIFIILFFIFIALIKKVIQKQNSPGSDAKIIS